MYEELKQFLSRCSYCRVLFHHEFWYLYLLYR